MGAKRTRRRFSREFKLEAVMRAPGTSCSMHRTTLGRPARPLWVCLAGAASVTPRTSPFYPPTTLTLAAQRFGVYDDLRIQAKAALSFLLYSQRPSCGRAVCIPLAIAETLQGGFPVRRLSMPRTHSNAIGRVATTNSAVMRR